MFGGGLPLYRLHVLGTHLTHLKLPATGRYPTVRSGRAGHSHLLIIPSRAFERNNQILRTARSGAVPPDVSALQARSCAVRLDVKNRTEARTKQSSLAAVPRQKGGVSCPLRLPGDLSAVPIFVVIAF